jgi:hypothetical protein
VLLRGYNPLLATISTPDAAPVIAATQLRAGNAASARGAGSLVAEAIATTKAVLAAQPRSAGGEVVLRADSAFYSRKVIAAARRGGVRFSVTIRIDKKVRRAIEAIPADAWVEITYPHPVWDDDQQRFVSRAHIAETTYTAFDKPARDAVTARLIVRRIPDLNKTAIDAQGELFPVWRYHAAFTDSPYVLVQAEAHHRGHAVIEQVFAELIDGPLAHLPSGRFDANNAWLTCLAIAHNLTRSAATLAGRRYATARAATVRRHLINLAARIARHARGVTIRLPPARALATPRATTVHSSPRATGMTVHTRHAAATRPTQLSPNHEPRGPRYHAGRSPFPKSTARSQAGNGPGHEHHRWIKGNPLGEIVSQSFPPSLRGSGAAPNSSVGACSAKIPATRLLPVSGGVADGRCLWRGYADERAGTRDRRRPRRPAA